MGQLPAPGTQLNFAFLAQCVANAGPQQLLRGLSHDLGVQEGVQGAAAGIEVVVEGVIRVVEHADGGNGGTVGGDGGEGEQGLVQLLGHVFAGVHRPAAAHGEEHIGILDGLQRGDHIAVFVGGVSAVPDGLTQGQLRALQGGLQLAVALFQGSLSADYSSGAAIPADNIPDFLVAVGAHAPGGQAVGVSIHIFVLLFSYRQNKNSFVSRCLETKL